MRRRVKQRDLRRGLVESGQSCVGAGPLWEGRNVVAEGGVVDLVDQDMEEDGSLVVRIRLDSGVGLDNEGGSYGRKQTGL